MTTSLTGKWGNPYSRLVGTWPMEHQIMAGTVTPLVPWLASNAVVVAYSLGNGLGR